MLSNELSNEQLSFICYRVADMPTPRSLAVQLPCAGCDAPLWVPVKSPSVPPKIYRADWEGGPALRNHAAGFTPSRSAPASPREQHCRHQSDRATRLLRHPANVRFTPESGHVQRNSVCPLCAKSGHQIPSVWEDLRRRLGQPTRTNVPSGSETANSYVPHGLFSGAFFPRISPRNLSAQMSTSSI
jgi:hypothetical protein